MSGSFSAIKELKVQIQMQQVIHQTKKYTKEKNLHALYPTVILQEQTRSSIYFLRHDVILSLTSM